MRSLLAFAISIQAFWQASAKTVPALEADGKAVLPIRGRLTSKALECTGRFLSSLLDRQGKLVRQTPLDVAARMIEEFGEQAKFLVDERVDMALQSEDATEFENWTLVAKALALLTQPKRKPVTERNTTGASLSVAEPGPSLPERRVRIS